MLVRWLNWSVCVCVCVCGVCVLVCRSEELAELCYASVLEDLGFVKAQDILVSDSSQVRRRLSFCIWRLVNVAWTADWWVMFVDQGPAPALAPPPQGPGEAEPVARPRETLEYKAALELEMWKETQEDLFDDQVRLTAHVSWKTEFRVSLSWCYEETLMFTMQASHLQSIAVLTSAHTLSKSYRKTWLTF